MKTLEKIKKGLECCTDEDYACHESCPYFEQSDCWAVIRGEILDYIQMLEFENEVLMTALELKD